MRIGVDARLLSEPVTGIGRYTVELARELVKLDGDFQFYTPKAPVVAGWDGPRSKLCSADFRGRIGKMIWSQTVLPYRAAKDQLDVFWGATHRLPRYLPESLARVVTIHDLVWKHAGETMRPLSRWMETRLMPEAIRLADRIMADSTSTAEAIGTEFPGARDKVRVVPLGVTVLAEPGGFDSLTSIGVDRPYFLFVGTLEPRKNLRRLLQAFATIPSVIRANALLVVAGGRGWGGIDLHSLLVQYGLETNVVLTGYVSDAQLATLYAHARFLAMPSLYEGFGLPLLEAMSFGVPVLTSNSSSLPEVAGDAGILVDPLSEDSIAEGLTLLLANEVLRVDLAARARPNAARFSWKKAARQAMDVFLEAKLERQSRRTSCS